MSPQTEMARRMAAVVRDLKPLFQARGFRKRRNTFNRETEPGLVHVVAFTMGRYELYGEPHDPFSGEYGFFWICFGVYVEEIAQRLGGGYGSRRDFVTEPDCELRVQSGMTGDAPRQGWYLGEEPGHLVARPRARPFVARAARACDAPARARERRTGRRSRPPAPAGRRLPPQPPRVGDEERRASARRARCIVLTAPE
jgi:hypothetical protein